jgi:hypothetical protein
MLAMRLVKSQRKSNWASERTDRDWRSSHMADDLKLENVNPKLFARVARLAGLACAIEIAAMVAFTLAIDPANSSCPGKVLMARNGSTSSIYLVALLGEAAAAWMCIIGIFWRRFAIRYNALLSYHKQKTASPPTGSLWDSYYRSIAPSTSPRDANYLDANRLFVVVAIAWVVFCPIPIFMIADQCGWPELSRLL